MKAILLREREGKAGGGKGFLLSDISFTLSSSNFHILFMTQIYPIDDGREVEKNQNGTGIGNEGDPAYTLDRLQSPSVVMAFDTFNQTVSDKNQTIKSHSANNENIGTVLEKSTVRRLTPTECERLQGFPDGWTDGQADSHRYKQMGNAVAVPVVEWIINRIIK